MQIKFASVMVDDQAKALKFYTDVLGFVKHADIPFGEFRWLTVIAPQGVIGAELVLEPMGFAPSKAYQRALSTAGIPSAFTTANIQAISSASASAASDGQRLPSCASRTPAETS